MSAFVANPMEIPVGDLVRSAKSEAFETMWRGLRSGELVPSRADFRPSMAVRFLSEIVLLDVPRRGEPRLTVRLVGTAVEARLQTDIVGRNYLDYLPADHREAAWRSARLMLDHPCGLWQMSNLHYERGTSHLVEMTAFPLAVAAGADVLIVHSNMIVGVGREPQPGALPMSVDTALTFKFIDVGAGLPAWSS